MTALARTIAVVGVLSGLDSASANKLNTYNTPSLANYKKIICPFLSTCVHEGKLPVKKIYTREELFQITLDAGFDSKFVKGHLDGNFHNNPSGVQDIFNMEGATNEHLTSSGIHDCPTTFYACGRGDWSGHGGASIHGHGKKKGGKDLVAMSDKEPVRRLDKSNPYFVVDKSLPETCHTKTPNPKCRVPNKHLFDAFVDACDKNYDKYIDLHEMEQCAAHLPYIADANPFGQDSILGSFSAIIELFGETPYAMSVDDFYRVFIVRKFPHSGYYFGRKPVHHHTAPSSSCFPGAAHVISGDGDARALVDLAPASQQILCQSPYDVLQYEEVLSLLHELQGGAQSYAAVTLGGGQTFRASETHMVFHVDENGSLRDATVGQLTAGMQLVLPGQGRGDAEKRGSVLAVERQADATGMFAPLTSSGKLVVDGVVASAYAGLATTSSLNHGTMHALMFVSRLHALLAHRFWTRPSLSTYFASDVARLAAGSK